MRAHLPVSILDTELSEDEAQDLPFLHVQPNQREKSRLFLDIFFRICIFKKTVPSVPWDWIYHHMIYICSTATQGE